MTTHLAIREIHEVGRSYKIDAHEAERRGLPVFVPQACPVAGTDAEVAGPLTNPVLLAQAVEWSLAQRRGDPPTIHLIALETAVRAGVDLAELRSESRRRSLTAIRYSAYYKAADQTFSTPAIGDYFMRHHTSILYGIWKHARLFGLPKPKGSCPQRANRRTCALVVAGKIKPEAVL
jgi:hypothetical protein